jgi:hypothetical protein
MRRREFIAGLGSATTWPFMARAQRAALPIIGGLGSADAITNTGRDTRPGGLGTAHSLD